MSWDAQAQCVGLPPEIFLVSFRAGRPMPGVPQVCDGCPVRSACLADGWFDAWSVRGGTTPNQRMDLARFLGLDVSESALASG